MLHNLPWRARPAERTHYPKPAQQWCADSGATKHMCKGKALFTEYRPLTSPAYIQEATRSMRSVLGKGTVEQRRHTEHGSTTLVLHHVLFVPTLHDNSCTDTARSEWVTDRDSEGCLPDQTRKAHIWGRTLAPWHVHSHNPARNIPKLTVHPLDLRAPTPGTLKSRIRPQTHIHYTSLPETHHT